MLKTCLCCLGKVLIGVCLNDHRRTLLSDKKYLDSQTLLLFLIMLYLLHLFLAILYYITGHALLEIHYLESWQSVWWSPIVQLIYECRITIRALIGSILIWVVEPEWLSCMTRNHVGSGLNPSVLVSIFTTRVPFMQLMSSAIL